MNHWRHLPSLLSLENQLRSVNCAWGIGNALPHWMSFPVTAEGIAKLVLVQHRHSCELRFRVLQQSRFRRAQRKESSRLKLLGVNAKCNNSLSQNVTIQQWVEQLRCWMLKSCNYIFTPYLQRKNAKFDYKIIPWKTTMKLGNRWQLVQALHAYRFRTRRKNKENGRRAI